MSDIEWKDIEGLEGLYRISSKGDVYSLPRIDEYYNGDTLCKRTRKGKFLKPMSKRGYFQVHLRDARIELDIFKAVHRLVAEHFVPNPENKPTVNHIDGNKQNNSVANLEWATHQENTIHAYKNGLARSRIRDFTKRLQDSPNTRLTNDMVKEIREKRKQGYTYHALSLEYPSGISAIHRICTNQSWKTLETT